MSQDLTPEHMRCDVGASCPSITRLDDGRLLIVGTDAHDLAIKYGIAPSPFEEAIVISPSLLDTLMEEARREERKLPPMVHPEGEPIVGATIDAGMWDGPVVATPEMERGAAENVAMNMARIEASNKSRVPELQKKVDEVQAKKRGRPRKKTPEERREAARERMRARRAK